ncbi:cytochrome P450 [Aspergillus ibericus CBS 121593]|uniref:Cytochrome P450 n=1 Tax=Aspergillus ibericus CBS 121593 TaxID=1448316 RepID=A0A395HC48_9EURO|nr:cytochrome P450 [Aspergillus ibericus CBS 121593]RAL04538.1 cytochrome P450 [Aspergillus ibericus CBS 121593]
MPFRACLNTYIGGTPVLLLGKWFTSLEFVIDGAGMISDIYRRIRSDRSFAIPALSEYQVLVSSEKLIRELSQSPESILSFHAAMEQRIKHKYTLFGFEHNNVDPNNDVPKRVLKVLLRMKLPQIQGKLQLVLRETLPQQLTGRDSAGWSRVSAFTLAKHVITRLNNHVLLGSELEMLGSDRELERAVHQYLKDAVVTMELCRHLPSVLVPLIAPFMMGWSGAMHRIARAISTEIERRITEGQNPLGIASKRRDCIQWVIESSQTSAQQTVLRITQQIFGILFASAHQMSMALVYAIFDLCLHPEYIESLRKEIEYGRSITDSEDYLDHLPLLDGFLRESARLNALDALTVQRMTLTPYTFSDGTYVPAGNLVAIPQAAVMQDSRYYADPTEFNPYRFMAVDERDGSMRAFPKYTDIRWNFPYWGSAKRACPGRWYVSRTLKLVLAHLIMEYDIKLSDLGAPRSFVWTTAIVPRTSTMITLRERAGSS